MPLINCEVELILTWSRNCVIIYINVNNQVPTFTITETNLYVAIVTIVKYLAKPELLARNAHLNHLIEPSFQGINRLCSSIWK